MAHLEKERAKKRSLCKTAHDSLSHALKDVASRIDNLTSLRLREMITDDEFQSTRAKLLQERERLSQAQAGAKSADAWFEPAELLISFSNTLASRFIEGDSATKRLILEIIGSNLVLMDKKLKIEAKKPFRASTDDSQFSSMCTTLKEVRILDRDR